jgi:(S)-mandelate dehydrogenase
VIGPTGFNGMLYPHGDVVLARSAARLGIPFTLSTFATARLEDVARAAGGRLWLQLYVMKDRDIGRDLVRRAAAAGYEALVFTTDANVFGSREWDQRNYRLPGRPTLRAALDVLRHPRWLAGVAAHGCWMPPSAGTIWPGCASCGAASCSSRECWTCATPSVRRRSGAMASCSATTAAGSWITVWRRSRCCLRSPARSVRA